MRRCFLSFILLCTVTLLGTLSAIEVRAAVQTATPQSESIRDMVVLADVSSTTSRLRLVDPAGGPIGDWIIGGASVPPAVISGPAGVLFISIGAIDGRGTDVLAISTRSGTAETIAQVSSSALVRAVSTSGDQLLMLTLERGLPASVASVPLPERWRGQPAQSVFGAQLANGTGLTSPLRWYGFDGAGRLWRAQLREDGKPAWTALAFQKPSAYWSLLVAPDGHTIYVVDYFHQHLFVFDAAGNKVTDSVSFGDEQFKRPICAAALDVRGDRLYLLANKYNSGDGMLVFDTRSWQQLDHLLLGINFSCIITSPDGHRLYATNGDSLTTIDVQTGAEQRTIQLDVEHADLWPLLAVTASK
jgi:YVTN family beta-propeller protein